MHCVQRIAPALALALLLPFAGSADAGAPQDGPRQLWVPWTVSAEAEGVEATLHHAAGLGFMPKLELGLGVSTRLQGDEAVNSVVGLVGGHLGPLAMGLGLSGIGDGPGTDSTTTRFDLGFALRLGDGFALGLQWYGLYSDVDDALDSFDTWSLSATMRPVRALSIGLALDQIDTPELGRDHLDAIARLSVGVRPGTERVTLGAEASRVLGKDALWTVGGSLRLMVVPGVVLGGYGRFLTAESGTAPDCIEVGAFLGLHQGGLGLESSVDARDTVGDGDSGMNLAMMLRARAERYPSVATDSRIVVKLPIRGRIPERPAAGLFSSGASGFAQWLQVLDVIATDPDVAGILLDIEAAPSWAQMWELRRALKRIKESGKKVFARLTVGDMRAMYLAAVADKVYLYASGGLMLTGLASTRTYYLGTLDKLGARAEFVKFEDYKSAPEALTRTGPSDPSREQSRNIVDGVWSQWLDAVTAGRKLDRAAVEQIVADGPQSYATAKDVGLVDELLWDDGLTEAIKGELGPGARVVGNYRPSPRAWKRWGGSQRIAIIPVVGSIVDGKSSGATPIPFFGSETTGDKTIVAAVERAVNDPSVIGIVVRVDSGGGSAIASDKMHRAIQKAAEKKPLVVSFGNVAASGGYYLAAGASNILASPMTVTGSIGIFTGKADLTGLYDKLGMTTHTEKTNDRADMLGSHRPWTEAERTKAKQTIKAYYDRFVELVSAGRKIPMDKAYALARGRVYLGGAALKLGLIDSYGGLWDAIERVRAEAGVSASTPLSLQYYGGLGSFSGVQRLIGAAIGLDLDAAPPLLGEAQAHASALFERLKMLADGGPLAMMPYTLTIQ